MTEPAGESGDLEPTPQEPSSEELFEGPGCAEENGLLEGPAEQDLSADGPTGDSDRDVSQSLPVSDHEFKELPQDLVSILKRVDKAVQGNSVQSEPAQIENHPDDPDEDLDSEQAPSIAEVAENEPEPKASGPALEVVDEALSEEVIAFLNLVRIAEEDEQQSEVAPAEIPIPEQRVKKRFRRKDRGEKWSGKDLPLDSRAEVPSQLDDSCIKSEQKAQKRKEQKLEVGGQLRSLEQALARSAPGKLPSGIKKRSIAAVSFLSSIPGTQRVLVAVENTAATLEVVAAGGVEGEDYLNQTSLRLLNSVLRTGEAILLLDSGKDKRFCKDKVLREVGVRSALCVAFEDNIAGTKGVLYIDNLEDINAFTYQDLRRAEDFCQRLAKEAHLGKLEEAQTQHKPEPLLAEVRPTNPLIYMATVVILVVMTLPSLFGSSRAEKEVEQAPRITTRETAKPEAVITGFLKALQSRNYRSAHLFLSEAKRESLSLGNFEKIIAEFMSNDRNLWTLNRLKIVGGNVQGSTQKNFELHPPQDGRPWKVVLQREGGAWRLKSIKGGLKL